MAIDNNVLQDLLDLIGRDSFEETVNSEDVAAILKAGVPACLKSQLDLIVGGGSERARMWTSEQWLNRAGYSPVQKVAVKQMLQLDPATLEALKLIAKEDDDPIEGVCQPLIEDDGDGIGADPGTIEREVQEVSVLLRKGGNRVPGSDSDVPSADVPIRPEPGGVEKAGRASEGSSQDLGVHQREADMETDPKA